MDLQKVAAAIRMARAHAGLCQRDVSARADVSHWRLQQFEAARVPASQSELDALSAVLPILSRLITDDPLMTRAEPDTVFASARQ